MGRKESEKVTQKRKRKVRIKPQVWSKFKHVSAKKKPKNSSLNERSDGEETHEDINVTLNSTAPDEVIVEGDECHENARYIAADDNDEIYGLLIMKESKEAMLSGRFEVQVIKGKINIFGYAAKKGTKPAHVFSSKLTKMFKLVEANDGQGSELLEEDKHCINKVFKDKAMDVVEAIDDCSSAAFIAKISSLPYHSAVEKDPCQIPFPEKPKHNQAIPKGVAPIEVEKWEPVVNEMLQCTGEPYFIALLCGAKNSGKSTFARFLINSSLNCFETVYFLECDVGQTEFTAPGIISLCEVNRPLIGPPFTHPTVPIASVFFGNIHSRDNPRLYTRCIEEAFNFYSQNCCMKGPLIINTQGWINGIGLALLIDVIKIAQPTIVIQLAPSSATSKHAIDFNSELILNKPGWSYDAISSCADDNNSSQDISEDCMDLYGSTRFLTIHSYAKASRDGIHFNPADYRTFSLLAYFNQIHKLKSRDRTSDVPKLSIKYPLQQFVPRILYFRDVAVHVMHCKVSPSLILHSLNFSLVSLSIVHPSLIVELPQNILPDGPKFLRENPVACHVGFAFIRNIDISRKAFIVLTPEREENLHQVNALLKGAVDLPTGQFDQESLFPNVYTTEDEQLIVKGAAARKPRFNLKRKKYHSRS